MHVPIAPQQVPDDLQDLEDLAFSPARPQGLAPLGVGLIARAHAPRGGLAQGGSGTLVQATVYPDSGSIKIQAADPADYFPQVNRDYPLLLVGTGKIKGPYCGTYHAEKGKTVGACATKPGKHRPAMIPNSCKRRECPECWTTWANVGKKRVSGVLNGFLNARLRRQRRLDPTIEPDYLPVHASFHPPLDLIVRLVKETIRELEGPEGITSHQFHRRFLTKFRKVCDEVIRSAGVTAYVDVYHSHRLRADRDAYEADTMQDSHRYRDVLDFEGWESKVKFSPHTHILCFGYIEDAHQFYERTGWTYRRHRVISNAEALVYYLVSHAPAIDGTHNIRYCGGLHPSKMMVEGEILVPQFPDCPACLEEGGQRGKSGYLIAKLSDVKYHRDERGKNQLIDWNFEIISNKPYRKTERIKVYRLLKPWEKPDRKGLGSLDRYMPKNTWDKLAEPLKLRYQFKQYYTLDQFAALPAAEQPQQWV